MTAFAQKQTSRWQKITAVHPNTMKCTNALLTSQIAMAKCFRAHAPTHANTTPTQCKVNLDCVLRMRKTEQSLFAYGFIRELKAILRNMETETHAINANLAFRRLWRT